MVFTNIQIKNKLSKILWHCWYNLWYWIVVVGRYYIISNFERSVLKTVNRLTMKNIIR